VLESLQNLPLARELIVVIIAMLPIFELRGAIPVAINVFHFHWYYALLLAIIGNLLPIPFILLFIDGVVKLLSKIAIFKRFFDWVFARTKRHTGSIQKYETIGLAIFVGIPLPFTGAWTGALAAEILGMSFWRAFVSIIVGVLIAGAIVTCLSLLGWWGAIIAGVGLTAAAVFGLWRF